MKHQPRVLIVEDEPSIAELVSVNLRHNGFAPVLAQDGIAAQRELDAVLPDAILLDWMLPGQSGLALARKWRSDSRTRSIPILMLTARGEESDRVRGLTAGADDYVVKPFSVPEFLARVTALLRRSAPERVADVLTAGDITLDREAHRVMRAGREVKLGPTEYRLLEVLLENAGRVLSRSQLLDHVWGNTAEIDDRTIDVHIGRLRKTLMRGSENDPIRTVRGAGYTLSEFAAE